MKEIWRARTQSSRFIGRVTLLTSGKWNNPFFFSFPFFKNKFVFCNKFRLTKKLETQQREFPNCHPVVTNVSILHDTHAIMKTKKWTLAQYLLLTPGFPGMSFLGPRSLHCIYLLCVSIESPPMVTVPLSFPAVHDLDTFEDYGSVLLHSNPHLGFLWRFLRIRRKHFGGKTTTSDVVSFSYRGDASMFAPGMVTAGKVCLPGLSPVKRLLPVCN